MERNNLMALTKDKLNSLTKYASNLKDSLAKVNQGEVPAKHVGHPATYKTFLQNELATVTSTLEAAKDAAMTSPVGAPKK